MFVQRHLLVNISDAIRECHHGTVAQSGSFCCKGVNILSPDTTDAVLFPKATPKCPVCCPCNQKCLVAQPCQKVGFAVHTLLGGPTWRSTSSREWRRWCPRCLVSQRWQTCYAIKDTHPGEVRLETGDCFPCSLQVRKPNKWWIEAILTRVQS